MENGLNDNCKEKNKVLEEKSVLVSHRLTWDQIRASIIRNHRLTPCSMVKPFEG